MLLKHICKVYCGATVKQAFSFTNPEDTKDCSAACIADDVML